MYLFNNEVRFNCTLERSSSRQLSYLSLFDRLIHRAVSRYLNSWKKTPPRRVNAMSDDRDKAYPDPHVPR